MIEQFRHIRTNKTLIMSVIAALILWWVVPYIRIDGSHPFSSWTARIVTALLISAPWLCRLLINKLGPINKLQLSQFPQWIKQGVSRCKESSHRLKHHGQIKIQEWKNQFNNRQEKRQIHKLPWYMIAGAPQSGKQYTIKQSGMHFVSPHVLGKEALHCTRTHHTYRWWFTTEAVFVNCGTTNSDNDTIIEKKFTRYLRRNRKSKPINGFIITYSINELLLDSHEKRQEKINLFATKIRHLHRSLNCRIPVYIILTKCDLVSGFTQFFNDLSQEELTQVWGMTFNLQNCENRSTVLNQFSVEFQRLMLRLQKRVLWALNNEKSQQGRELIHAFPQQMQLFNRPITTFISELFAATKYNDAIQCRGVYLTSAMQNDRPYDFLLAAIGKQYQLSKNPLPNQLKREESYFLSQLFNEVILPEGDILGENIKLQRLKKFAYRASLVAAPFLLIGGTISMSHAYQFSKNNIHAINDQISLYNNNIRNLKPDDGNIVHVLPALNAINMAYENTRSQGATRHYFISNSEMENAAYNALIRNIHGLFLPRIAAYLESQLNNSQNDDARNLYVMLKGYLAFSPQGYTQASTIVAPMESTWNTLFHDDKKTHHTLLKYLRISAEQQMDMLPLNRPLINTVRLRLQQIVPSERAYALLNIKATTSDIPDIDFPSIIGMSFHRWFSDSREKKFINRLYTASGYKAVYLLEYHDIAQQVANDNIEIGLDQKSTQSSTEIQNQVSLTYNNAYIQTWNNALSHIQIKPISKANELLALLTDLSSNNSPLKQLLNIIESNTSEIKNNHIHISQVFNSLNNYTDNLNSDATYSATLSVIKQLDSNLLAIEQSGNKQQAYFKAAKDYISGDKNNPLIKLSRIAEKSPQPVKRWILSIQQSYWNVMMTNAMKYINNAWSVQVMQEYNDNIKHHYPVYRLSSNDMSVTNFSHFFSPKGTLNTFFIKYLKPFVDNDSLNWKLDSVYGRSLTISNQQLTIFKQADSISKHFFSTGQTPHVELTLQPRTLTKHAAGINITMGDNGMTYQHGPRTPLQVVWPLSNQSLESKITLNDFRGNHFTHHAYGPWAMFKILNSNGFTMTMSNGHTVLHTALGSYSATFNVDSNVPISTLRLRTLTHFRLPKTLEKD